MGEIKLIKGCGRTGNFIICLLNIILYAEKNNYSSIDISKIHWSSSPAINKTLLEDFFKNYKIKINSNNNDVKDIELRVERFYKMVNLTFEKRIEYINKYIKPIMNINTSDAINIGKNDLVIHLRSGDIMVGGNHEMIQPPLEFYEKVIELRKWDKIYVITERDPLNPIFNVLVEKYNPITFMDDNRGKFNGYNFKKDFDYLIKATHYVPCQSSLCPFIIQLSETIKHVYVPSYYFIRYNANYIWWSKNLHKKKNNVKINDIEFKIFEYDKYVTTKDMHIYIKDENKQLLLDYKSGGTPESPI